MKFKETVEEIKKYIDFKDDLNTGDNAVMVCETNEQIVIMFCRIIDIVRDTSKKDEWWFVSYVMLNVPMVATTNILRTDQMTGKETYTMNGENRFFAPIDFKIPEEETKPILTLVPDA